WAIVSGRQKLPLWYWKDAKFDLEKQFSSEADMRWINRLLGHLVVERERDCGWQSADQLLDEVDAILAIVKRSGQGLERGILTKCTVCGRGPCREIISEDSQNADLRNFGLTAGPTRFRVYQCDACGHLEWFRMNDRPSAWGEL